MLGRLLQRRSEERLSFDQYLEQVQFSFNGQPYVLTPSGMIGGNYAGADAAQVANVYRNNGVIFACILARLLLFTEARFKFRPLTEGRPGNLYGTPALTPLEQPWPNGTTGELLARMEQDASLYGNSYWVADRERRMLRRLDPRWVSIAADEYGPRGYIYAENGDVKNSVEYTVDEVAHYSPLPDPWSPWRGMSWLTPIVREIDADSGATEHKLAFFRNGATPSMAVKFDPSIPPAQLDLFREKMESAHRGSRNAYKTLYLGGGADVTVVGKDFQQLEFKATQGAGETRIAAAAGVPPIIVGLSEGLSSATYSNYGMARRKFGDHWARPHWRMAAASLAKLVTVPDGSELWYDDRDIAFLREDVKDQADINSTIASTIKTYIDAGYDPDAAVDAAVSGDATRLSGKHSGLYSVQLQPAGAQAPAAEPAPPARSEQLVVNFNQAATNVDVTVPERSVSIENTIEAPPISIDSPVTVNLPEQPPPDITVNVEERSQPRIVTKHVTRDGDGKIATIVEEVE